MSSSGFSVILDYKPDLLGLNEEFFLFLKIDDDGAYFILFISLCFTLFNFIHLLFYIRFIYVWWITFQKTFIFIL